MDRPPSTQEKRGRSRPRFPSASQAKTVARSSSVAPSASGDAQGSSGSSRGSRATSVAGSDRKRKLTGQGHGQLKRITDEEKQGSLPHSGVVVTYKVDKQEGWIKCKEGIPSEFNKDKDVYFKRHFTRVTEGAKQPPMDLSQWKVKFRLHEKFTTLPRAAFVLLVDGPDGDSGNRNKAKVKRTDSDWLEGEVMLRKGRNGETEIHLKSRFRSYYMFSDKISRYSLPLVEGDKVKFQLQPNKEGNLKVKTVRMHKFMTRSREDLNKFLASLQMAMTSMDANRAILELLPHTSLWTFLAEDMQDSFSLLHVLNQMLKLCQGKNADASQVIEYIAETDLARNIQQLCTLPEQEEKIGVCGNTAFVEKRETILTFLKETVRVIPHKLSSFKPLIIALQTNPDPFINDLMHHICVQLTSSSDAFDSTHWSTMAPVPLWKEILGNPLHEDKMLKEVSTNTFYSDPDEYMETYYRLARTELFSKIQKGIKDLLRGHLDTRDMDCYTSVAISAVHVSPNGFKLGLVFKTEKPVKNWESSRKLMFGNLLCISPSQSFDDVIWAEITDRDPLVLKKKGTIFVELCDFNTKSHVDIIASLQANRAHTIMVESPTYFRSLWPVLSSLKAFDGEAFGLGDKIIRGIFDQTRPKYTTEPRCVNLDSIDDLESHGENDNVSDIDQRDNKESWDSFEMRKKRVDAKREAIAKSLDEAQQDAFNFCLDNVVSVVQGPPGCGKTFLGVKLVENLLQWKLDRPILVMTYKNHALDEFLKHCSELSTCTLDGIVRIGSRSKEESLDQCNLAAIVKDMRTSRLIYDNLGQVKDEIRILGDDVQKNMKHFMESSQLNTYSMLKCLTEDQLEQFLLDANWKDIGYTLQGGKNVTAAWIKGNMLPKIRKDFGTVSEFFDACYQDKVKNAGMAQHCYGLFVTGLTKWLPNKRKIQEHRNLNDRFAQTNTANEDIDDTVDSEDDPDDVGADYVQEQQESRQMARSTRDKENFQIIKEAVFFEKTQSVKDPYTYELSDFPTNMSVNETVLYSNELWSFSEAQKIQFLYSHIQSRVQEARDKLNKSLTHLDALLKQKSRLELDRKVSAVRGKKVLGVTITGASINHDLLHLIAPQVVIVEEAAEILEPSLIAALHSNVEHLILIGDHKQLRPQVDTYELVKQYSFDISMMERLVRSNAPFKMLKTQNRMRPEFSALLRDIYPDLQDNLVRVLKNEPAKCLEKSMYFWAHDFSEDSIDKKAQKGHQEDRSKRNTKEAEMIMATALFLLTQGYCPSQITILAAYLGQQKILRNMQKDLQNRYAYLFRLESGECDFFQIQTVDMYQGDENDFVLISLTRGNPMGSIGFMKLLNRRCVAQSRAKCGMYFVGNLNTYCEAEKGVSVWQPFLAGLSEAGCIGNNLVVQCGKHKSECQKSMSNAQELMSLVDNPQQLCPLPCGDLFHCQKKEHACKKTCSPPHRHHKCFAIIREPRPDCGHPAIRKCHEDLSKIPCEIRMVHTFDRCGHQGMKKCYVKTSTLMCKQQCPEKMSCNLHDCVKLCGEVGHPHSHCTALVDFNFPDCGHKGTKECWKPVSQVECTEIITRNLPKCEHDVQVTCSLSTNRISCPHPCELPMMCKKPNHKCPRKCGDAHGHDNCIVKIKYSFPNCGHPSPRKKKCSEPITWKCTTKVTERAPCGHSVEKACSESIDSAFCLEVCSKQRSCGHPCTNRCSDPCDRGSCDVCEQVRLEQLDDFKKKAKEKKNRVRKELKQSNEGHFFRSEIADCGETKAEYLSVTDKVMNYIKDMHHWTPKIIKIEKVRNLRLEINYEEAKLHAFGDVEDLKFHGTSDDGVEGITKNGFRMPAPPTAMSRPGMFGQGIYFATDSSKSAQEIYTKGSHKLLLCQVLLGRSKVVNSADNTLCKKRLRKDGFDSVFAPRGTAVKNDEFIIFNPAQALPVYIIHYRNGSGLSSPSQSPTSTKSFEIIKLQPSREFNANDPKDNYFRIAEAHFMRMAGMKGPNTQHKIKYVDYVYNQALSQKFEATKNSFKSKGIPSHEVLAFHGTPAQNIDSILRKNLDPKCHRRQAHGPGSYFSEFPDISLGYGNGLILFKTLPGKEYCGNSSSWTGYNSKKVNPQFTKGYGDMLIIQNPDQFMPFFAFHLE